MVLLMLMIIHVMVTILSYFLHLHIPFNHTLVLIFMLFPLVNFFVKEFIYIQSISILIIMLKKTKPINTIVYLRKIINSDVNVIFYD